MPLLPDVANKNAKAVLDHRANIVVGGKDKDKFAPNINFGFDRKQSDEFFLNINASDVIINGETAIIDEVSSIVVGDRTERYYIDENGDLEYEIVFDSKPVSNAIDLEIKCSPSLKFYHQPDMTADPKVNQPDDIINSYAVYCDKRDNQYQTGKVAHIKRSWVKDKDGIKNWCGQTISASNGQGDWSITIPDAIWNDASKYPIIIGPTFGTETIGGTNGSASTGYAGGKHTPSNGGNLTKLFWYAASTRTDDYYAACYKRSDLSLVGYGNLKSGLSMGWNEFDLTGTIDTIAHLIGFWGGDGAENIPTTYDTGVSGDGFRKTGYDAPPPADPVSGGFDTPLIYSVYAVYTIHGGAGPGQFGFGFMFK